MIYIVKCISKFSKMENLLFEKLAGMMDRKGDQIRVIDLLEKGGGEIKRIECIVSESFGISFSFKRNRWGRESFSRVLVIYTPGWYV